MTLMKLNWGNNDFVAQEPQSKCKKNRYKKKKNSIVL